MLTTSFVCHLPLLANQQPFSITTLTALYGLDPRVVYDLDGVPSIVLETVILCSHPAWSNLPVSVY